MKIAPILVVGFTLLLPVRGNGPGVALRLGIRLAAPIINQAARTHTWATFVRVAADRARPGSLKVEPHTVSWMPATLVIRPMALLAEPGVNLDLHRSLQWAYEDGPRVSMWGPYQIDNRLFKSALAEASRLGKR